MLQFLSILPIIFLVVKLVLLNTKFLYQMYNIIKQLEKGSYLIKFNFFEFNRVDIVQGLTLEEREKRLLIIYTLISPPLFMFLSKSDILDIIPQQGQISRTPRKQFWKLVNKQNVVKVNGKIHKVRRRLLSNYFQFDNIKIIADKTEKVSQEIFELRRKGIKQNLKLNTLEQDFQEITQKIVCQTMFQGLTDNEKDEWELIQTIQDVRHMARDLFETPFSKFRSLFIDSENIPYILMTQNEKFAYKKLLKLRELFFKRLETRKHSNYKDIITQYVEEIQNQKGEILLDKEGLFQDFMAIFAGSIDPVTTLSSNCIFQIGKNPEILRKVLQELKENMNIETKEINYQNMDYLHTVTKEALRMFTTSPFLGQSQVNVSEFVVQNQKKQKIVLPRGYLVDCSLLTMMMAESNYEQPNLFKPERFMIKGGENQYDSFIPFGGGNRVCFGQHMSPIQAKIVVCQFLLKFVLNEDLSFKNQVRMRVENNNKLIIGQKEVFLQHRKKACPACQTHFTPHCDPKKHLKSVIFSYNTIFIGFVLFAAFITQFYYII